MAGASTTRLEVVLERRFSRGLQARVAYTYSHLMNNGAEVGQGDDGRNAGIQNPADPLPWMLSDDDTPHVLLSGFTWEIPGPSQGVMKQVLGGWNVSGILRYESGRPMTITMTNDLGGLLFNTQKRPNQVGEGMADFGDFDPFEDRYYNRAGWADPGPLQFGNAPERDGDVRGFPNFSEDINIFKVFPIQRRRRDSGSSSRSATSSTARSTAIPRRTGARRTSGRCSRSATPRGPLQLGFRFDF